MRRTVNTTQYNTRVLLVYVRHLAQDVFDVRKFNAHRERAVPAPLPLPLEGKKKE
jgi:hypothetical protein